MSDKIIKAYKGFNKDLSCRGFKYEVGKEYEHDGPVYACESGFHACETPMDCLCYYAPSESVYHEVELSGTTDKDTDDSKIAASHIKIGAQLDIAGICKATFEYVKSKCTNENNAEPGKPATAGDSGAATAGDSGAATAGNYGAATAGDSGAATSRGKSSSGANGLSVARGNNVKVRGGLGAILVIAEECEDTYDITSWKAAKVDGEKIKADTWYELVDGEFTECDD